MLSASTRAALCRRRAATAAPAPPFAHRASRSTAFTTSATLLWRTRQERREALHRRRDDYDGDDGPTRVKGRSSSYRDDTRSEKRLSSRRVDFARLKASDARYAELPEGQSDLSWTRRRSRTRLDDVEGDRGASAALAAGTAARRTRRTSTLHLDGPTTAGDTTITVNLPRKQRKQHREHQSFGLFDDEAVFGSNKAGSQRTATPAPQHQTKRSNRPSLRNNVAISTDPRSRSRSGSGSDSMPGRSAREKEEVKEKVKMSMAAVQQLPPLTDQDFQDMYQDLLSYDNDSIALPSREDLLSLPYTLSKRDYDRLIESATAPVLSRISELEARLGQITASPAAEDDDGQGDLQENVAEERTSFVDDLKSLKRTKDVQAKSAKKEVETQRPSKESAEGMSDGDELQSHPAAPVDLPMGSRAKVIAYLDKLLPETPSGGSRQTSMSTTARSKAVRPKAKPSSIQSAVATSQEWAALMLSAAADFNSDDVCSVLDLMQRAAVPISEDLICAVVRVLSNEQSAVSPFLQHLEMNGHTLTPLVHHEVITGMLRGKESVSRGSLIKALRYLRHLEESNTPALSKTYAFVIRKTLDSRKEISHSRERAYNLYAHMRLVAHPTPDIEAFNTMIYACGLDDRVAPERALDLFTELTELGLTPNYYTYNNLIRTLARSRDEVFYFEALKLLKELLERNFTPDKAIFLSLLEGSRIRGDVLRATWIVQNMLDLTRKGAAGLEPDEAAFASLFFSMAAAKVRPAEVPTLARVRRQEATREPTTLPVASTKADGMQPTQTIIENGSLSTRTPDMPDTEATSGSKANEQQLAEQPAAVEQDTVGQASNPPTSLDPTQDHESREGSSKPPPEPEEQEVLPRGHPRYTVDEVLSSSALTHPQMVAKARLLLSSILQSQNLDTAHLFPSTPVSAGQGADSSVADVIDLDAATRAVLREVHFTHYLANAYFAVLCGHGDVQEAADFFKNALPAYRITPTEQLWETLFERLNKGKGRRFAERSAHARDFFQDWKIWLARIEDRVAKASAARAGPASNGSRLPFWWNRHIERIWSAHIEILARSNDLDEAYEQFEAFVQLHPPSAIVEQAKAEVLSKEGQGTYGPQEEREPGYLVQMSSFLYPETTDSTPSSVTGRIRLEAPPTSRAKHSRVDYGVPPHLTNQGIYLLRHRLIEEEEDGRADKLLRRFREYGEAINEASRIREDRESAQHRHGVKVARKTLIAAPRAQRHQHQERLEGGRSEDYSHAHDPEHDAYQV